MIWIFPLWLDPGWQFPQPNRNLNTLYVICLLFLYVKSTALTLTSRQWLLQSVIILVA